MSNLNLIGDNFFKSFLDNSPFPIWIEDITTKIIYFNNAYEKMFNISLSKVIGKTNMESFPDELANKYNEQISLCIKLKSPLKFEDKVNDRYIECSMFPLKDSTDSIFAIGGILIDITERKENETSIKVQKNILRTIIDALPEAIFYKDRNSKFIGFNKNFEEFYNKLGITDILDKTDLEIYPNKDIAQQFIDLDNELMTKKESRYSQYTINNPDGTITIEESIKVPVINDKGEAWGIVGLARDITSSKMLEEKLTHLSYTDILTGLYNRSSFEEKIRELDDEHSLPLGIIMGDVNGLKLINDSLGHLEGDKYLKDISNIIKASCNNLGFAFRWGGDEFVLLIPNCDEKICDKVIETILDRCSKHNHDFVNLSIALAQSIKHTKDDDIYNCIKEVEEKVYRRKLLDKKSVRSTLIDSLKRGLEEKNMETQEHTDRVAQYAYKIGKELDFSISDLDELYLVANFHDIGKIGINEDILLKPSKLTSEEFEIMKTHCEKGYRIINALGELENVAKCVLTHHEKYDGTGYPLGLSKEDIPLISRIISVADSYDVMTTERPYKKAMSKTEAIAELKRCSNTQFDPKIVELFINKVIN